MLQLKELALPDGKLINVIEMIGTEACGDLATCLLNDDYGKKLEAELYASQKKVHKLFTDWLDGSGKPATWYALVDCLRFAQLNSMADNIESVLETNEEAREHCEADEEPSGDCNIISQLNL